MSEKKNNAHRQAQQLQDTLAAEQEENSQLQQKHGAQLHLWEERKAEQRTAQIAIKQLQDQLNRTPGDIEEDIESQKSVYIELMNEQATVRNELKNLELQELQLSESSSRIAVQQADFSKELAKLETEKAHAEK